MAQTRLRPVADDNDGLAGDPALEGRITAAMEEHFGPERSVRSLIARSRASLVGLIDSLRKQAAEIETEMGAANADHDKSVAAAAALRDARLADARADLRQVTDTIAALETARTKLAESAG